MAKKKNDREFERKTMPAWTKDVSGRTVVGITAVTGNVDDGGDRIIFGAFAKTITENSRRFRHLWQHGADGWDYGVTPPIAAIKRIQEVGREALPQAVIDFAPMATGGLEVEREYLATPRGEEILAAYQAGIQLEMSIGFETIIRKWIDNDSQRVTFGHYRDLIEIKLFDTSDVNWGMNSATVGSKTADRLKAVCDRLLKLRGEMDAKEFHSVVAALGLEFKPDGGDPDEEPPPPMDYFSCPCCTARLKLIEADSGKRLSRAEPSIGRISLTPSLKRLRELELALIE